MIPFLVLVVAALALRALGAAGLHPLGSWIWCVRGGLAAMFLLTASAHWGRRGRELAAMVPRVFPRADLMVGVTGVLEILGAAGLLIPRTTSAAAVCLAILLLAIFPANVRAAHERLTIGSRPATKLPLRTLLQLVYIGALVVAGFPEIIGLTAG